MYKFKSKIEQRIYDRLNRLFVYDGSPYSIHYENTTLNGTKYKLLIDFTIMYKGEPIYHIEYSGMNYFKKYLIYYNSISSDGAPFRKLPLFGAKDRNETAYKQRLNQYVDLYHSFLSKKSEPGK